MDILKRIRKKIDGGKRLTRQDGLALLGCPDILSLGMLADEQKRKKTGEYVFFNSNCHVNLTNICVSRCSFCAFSRDPHEAGSYLMTPDEAVEKVRAAVPAGITEVHMVSGLHPERPFSYYVDAVRKIKGAFPSLHIKAFTPVEIHYFSTLSGLSIRKVLEKLVGAGLNSLPGGGAEVLSDRVRQQLCPKKAASRQWLHVMRTAHRLGLKSNATLLFGHMETAEETMDHLLQLRRLQDETGGFQTFIPLPFHPRNTQIDTFSKPTACEQLKLFTVSRLMLDNFDHVKAYWVMTGLKVAQLALCFGADDIDGTVTEEKITHAAGAETATGLTKTELITLIRQAGKTPVERDTVYNIIQKY